METSYLKTLELNKIIERAAAGCVCKEAKAKMLELAPLCDPDEVRFALEQTDAINTLLIKNGSPGSAGWKGSARWPPAPSRAASSRWASCFWWRVRCATSRI